ncbi:helix-turn-helix transcriptional regulator [Streptomyces sp. NPDC001107]
MMRGEPGSESRPPVHVVVVEDHEVTRGGLVAALKRDRRLKVVGQMGSLGELADSGAEYDVCVTDLMGIGTLEQFTDLVQRADVVVCTAAEGWDHRVAAWVLGARAVFGKTVGPVSLADAVWDARHHPHLIKPHLATALESAVGAHRLPVDPDLAVVLSRTARGERAASAMEATGMSYERYRTVLEDLRRRCDAVGLGKLDLLDNGYLARPPQGHAGGSMASSSDWAAHLTTGQLQILELHADGYSLKEVSDQLGIRISTVLTQVKRAMEHFGITTRAAEPRLLFAMYVCSRHPHPELLLRRLKSEGFYPPTGRPVRR